MARVRIVNVVVEWRHLAAICVNVYIQVRGEVRAVS